jgi:hypothetical protein
MFRKEETIYQSTQCHIPEEVFNRNIRSKELSAYRRYPSSGADKAPFTTRRRWPQRLHNTLSFYFYLEWILFCRQKAVLWIPATRSGSNFANNYSGRSVICSGVPDLKTSSKYEHDTHSVSPAIGRSSAHA